MATLFQYNGLNVVSIPASPAPSSIDFTFDEFVSANSNPFDGSQQIYDWQQSLVSASMQLPPMAREDGDKWAAWLLSCRGMANAFLIGDPAGKTPKGSNLTTGASPLVDGAGQKGYSLKTKGWQANKTGVLKAGDLIQLIYRVHRMTDDADTDADGKATLNFSPPIREIPADGQAIVTTNTKGLFRLASNQNKFSIGLASIYGFNFAIREAF